MLLLNALLIATNQKSMICISITLMQKGDIVGKVTISSKFQVVIPREVRKQLQLKVGQKLKVVVKGQTINLVLEVPLAEMRGFLRANVRQI